MFELPKDSSSVTLKVYDELGNKISDKQLQGLKAGEHKFSWDGMNTNGEKQPSGQYHFQVEALTTDSQTMPVKVTTKIKINGVDIKDPEGAFFTEVGKIKAADLMSVNELKQAFLPEVKPTESKPQEVKPVPEKKLSSKNENPEKTQKLSQG